MILAVQNVSSFSCSRFSARTFFVSTTLNKDGDEAHEIQEKHESKEKYEKWDEAKEGYEEECYRQRKTRQKLRLSWHKSENQRRPKKERPHEEQKWKSCLEAQPRARS